MQTEPVAVIGSKFPDIVIPLLDAAKHSVRVLVYDWRFYPTISGSPVSRFNAAVFAAVARGVGVRALVNNDAVAARLRVAKCDARVLHSARLLHTKMLLVDDTQLVIGSHNYTQNAFSLNEEASVLVTLPSSENDFASYFDALWGV